MVKSSVFHTCWQHWPEGESPGYLNKVSGGFQQSMETALFRGRLGPWARSRVATKLDLHASWTSGTAGIIERVLRKRLLGKRHYLGRCWHVRFKNVCFANMRKNYIVHSPVQMEENTNIVLEINIASTSKIDHTVHVIVSVIKYTLFNICKVKWTKIRTYLKLFLS